MRYDISVSTQLNIARCREHEGDLVEAWNDYNRARILNRETDDEARRNALGEYLEKSVAALERRLPKVRVVIQRPPAHLTISSDGTPVVQSAAGEPFPINPGEHEIAVAAPGHRTEKRTVTLVEGQALELVFDMVVGEDPDATTDAKPAPAPTPLPDQPTPPPPDDGIAPWAWPVGAVGIVALGAGIGVAVLSVSARSKLADGCTNNGGTFECPDDEFSQNDIDGLVRDANAGLGGALALGGVGIACIAASAAAMAGSSSRESSSTSIRLVPLLARQRGGRLSAGALFESRF
jgi:hypothetical protein